ncbi:MAG TPA: hypothetical protein DIW07_08955 [Lachnospiraceae bacterium]|nr:hypothetical protein [Lachnospiraceae bacterium]
MALRQREILCKDNALLENAIKESERLEPKELSLGGELLKGHTLNRIEVKSQLIFYLFTMITKEKGIMQLKTIIPSAIIQKNCQLHIG